MRHNPLGRLVEKRLHGTNATASDAKESIDYTYNIRGWLTSINDPQNNPRLFAEALKYNNPGFGEGVIGQYTGNISQVIWRNGGYMQSYGYTYDALNRLKNAAARFQRE